MKKNILVLTVLAGLTVLGTSLYLSRGDSPKARPEKPQAVGHQEISGSRSQSDIQKSQEAAVSPASDRALSRGSAATEGSSEAAADLSGTGSPGPLQGPGSDASPKARPEKPRAQNRELAWGNAPDISLTMLDGKSLKLSDFKGDLIVLNFWVAGCGYCRMQMPDLNRLYTEHKDRGVVVIGVNLDGYSIPRLRTFYEKKKLLYPVAAGDRYKAAGRYGVRGFPTTFIIDRKGNVARRYIGYTDYKIFAAALQKSGTH